MRMNRRHVLAGLAALPLVGGVRAQSLDSSSLNLVPGSLDDQSLGGKTPLGVAAAAAAAGKPVVAVCGRSTLSPAEADAAGFRAVYPLSEIEPDPAVSIAKAKSLLVQVGARIASESLAR